MIEDTQEIIHYDPAQEVPLSELILLQERTCNRLTFEVDAGGRSAIVRYCNYYRSPAGNTQLDDKTMTLELLPPVEVRVILI